MGPGHHGQEYLDLGHEKPHHNYHATLQGQGLRMGMAGPCFHPREVFDT